MSDVQSETRAFCLVKTLLVNDKIASRVVDVLVNAANDRLHMGGGVAAALRSKCGIEIHQEAIRQGPARIGSVIRTGAGRLAARHVYHAVVIDYETRAGTSRADVELVVRTILSLAGEDGARSVALPLFGAGVGGLSVEASLHAILEAIESTAPQVQEPLTIEIVAWDRDEHARARAVLAEYEGREARQEEEDRLAEEALRSLLGESK
jgi:O-acetyl-ADP-ribose deacetylase (regulator of RNase III)